MSYLKEISSYKESLKYELSVYHKIGDFTQTMPLFHYHDFFEIMLCLSDGPVCYVGNHAYNIKKNSLFTFNHTDHHKTVIPSGATHNRYNAAFYPDYMQAYNTSSTNLFQCFLNRGADFDHCIQLSNSQCENLIPLFQKLNKSPMKNSYGEDVQKKITMAEILLMVNNFYQSTHGIILHKDESNKKVSLIIEYIQEHYAKELSLDHLAKKFYISKSHLCSVFKEASGYTVNQYIVNIRIANARKLLKKNLPVLLVCDMVGFGNESHFIRTFKRLVGLSPKQYAKTAQYTEKILLQEHY